MSKKRPTESGATRGGPHHALFVFVPISACCVDQWVIVLQNVPTKGKRLPFRMENVRLVLVFWVVQCSDSPCYGATVEEVEQDQDEEDIEDFVAFSIKSFEGFAILVRGATKTVSGFMSVQPVADQYEGTTIETTNVGIHVRWWRNGGSKHENLYTTR